MYYLESEHKIILTPPHNIYDQSRHLIKTSILFTALVFLMHKSQLNYTVPQGVCEKDVNGRRRIQS